jgi:hypothetical protein
VFLVITLLLWSENLINEIPLNAKKLLSVIGYLLSGFLASHSPDGALKLIRYLQKSKNRCL